jgi:hypothetical protein
MLILPPGSHHRYRKTKKSFRPLFPSTSRLFGAATFDNQSPMMTKGTVIASGWTLTEEPNVLLMTLSLMEYTLIDTLHQWTKKPFFQVCG